MKDEVIGHGASWKVWTKKLRHELEARRELISLALHQRCRPEDNWTDVRDGTWRGALLRAWYTVKAVICVAIGRERDANDRTTGLDGVQVATYNYVRTTIWDYGDGAEWDMLLVERGFLHSWFFYVEGDGYP